MEQYAEEEVEKVDTQKFNLLDFPIPLIIWEDEITENRMGVVEKIRNFDGVQWFDWYGDREGFADKVFQKHASKFVKE